MIEEMATILGPISFSPTAFQQPDRHTVAEQRIALEKLAIALNHFITEQRGHSAIASAHVLRSSLSDLLAHLDKGTIENAQEGEQLLQRVLHNLPRQRNNPLK